MGRCLTISNEHRDTASCFVSTICMKAGVTKEDLCIEAQQRGKNFELIIKSSLLEGIFIDAKCVHCASLETVRAKKIFLITISEVLLEHKHLQVSEFIGYHICKQNAICALKSFKSFYKNN